MQNLAKFTLTNRDIMLAAVIAVMGAVLNSQQWLMYLVRLTPIQGILVYYALVWGSLYALQRMGLSVLGFKISRSTQTFGLLLLNFTFHIVTNWANPFVQWATTGSLSGESNVFVNNSEDSVVWYCVYTLAGITNIQYAWFLTFVVIPFFITIVALYLIRGKPAINPI